MSAFVPPIRRVDTAKGHHYKDAAGTRVPGVTTLNDKGIPKPGLIEWAGNATAEYAVDHWDELGEMKPAARLKRLQRARYEDVDKAKNRGTEVHKAAEQLLAGKTVQVPDEIAGHVESYARFLEEFKVDPAYVEFSCVSYRWGYAGTADLYANVELPLFGPSMMLLDLKTSRSGIFGETALQLAGYRFADFWVVDGEEMPPPHIDYCAGIHVRGDGYDLVPIEAGEDQHRIFLYSMRIGRFVETSRELIGPPIIAPTTSTLRLVREDKP